MVDLVNLDFDFALSKNTKNLRNEKIIREFEYIYFFINNNPSILHNVNDYTSEYLLHLKEHGYILPELTSKKPTNMWWGDLSNFERTKKYNSKINLLNILEKEKVFHPNLKEVQELRDVEKIKMKSYYRSEHGFSGINNKIIIPEKRYSLKLPGVVGDWLKIVESYGITVFSEDDYFICRNLINERGTFIGGEIVKDHLFLDEVKKSIKLLSNYYPYPFQFDNLIYDLNEEKRHYPIVEVNYRKTMALMVHSLYEKFGEGKWIISKDAVKNSIIKTSPRNVNHNSYYIASSKF